MRYEVSSIRNLGDLNTAIAKLILHLTMLGRSAGSLGVEADVYSQTAYTAKSGLPRSHVIIRGEPREKFRDSLDVESDGLQMGIVYV